MSMGMGIHAYSVGVYGMRGLWSWAYGYMSVWGWMIWTFNLCVWVELTYMADVQVRFCMLHVITKGSSKDG